MTSEAERLFGNSFIAGPMVRGSSHVFRMACLSHGADVVYSQGLVDIKLADSQRRDENGHTVFFSESNGHSEVVFRTCADERNCLILQLVSNDSATAIRAIQNAGDVAAGFDLNCGCPEHFAVHRGCGSSMQLEQAVDIIKALARATPKPVSVKFRVQEDVEQSIQFAQAMESAGAAAITVHGRLKEQKHKGTVDYAKMKQIFDSVKIFKIGNGGITSLVEAQRMKEETGCHSVMICNAALKNPSVFSPTMLTEAEALRDMVSVGKKHDIPFNECKWSLQQIIAGKKDLSKELGQSFSQCKAWEDLDTLMTKSVLKQ